MSNSNIEKIIECYRKLQEEGGMGGGAPLSVPTNNASSGKIAGLPPDDPPVDLRKRKYKKLNMFYRQSVKGDDNARRKR
jgi:hypothetical protein